ncbi:MAG: phosphoribosylformylglycinamidine synthase I [Clostridiales bacterium]|nr:phosphoribosylformylglycinamidine synthase I [Clostridiales bacterium]MCF8021917.1 phosphoribosylformylglycinamidine synthase I [Clostridiales bacterium]
MIKPRACILRTDGTNCDLETRHAVEKAGGDAQLVHINHLRENKNSLFDFQLLIIPGGFTYGDDVHSGKILAVELLAFLKEQMLEFIYTGNLILGICNGFQVLMRTGLLPGDDTNNITGTLTHNDSGRFECRWVNMLVQKSNCIFTQGLEDSVVSFQAAHGEGKFYTDKNTLNKIEDNNQVVLRYSTASGELAESYPDNPNGSLNAVAGISDKSGKVMGLMPHPERFVEYYHHPNWRRKKDKPHGLIIFENAINYINKK